MMLALPYASQKAKKLEFIIVPWTVVTVASLLCHNKFNNCYRKKKDNKLVVFSTSVTAIQIPTCNPLFYYLINKFLSHMKFLLFMSIKFLIIYI